MFFEHIIIGGGIAGLYQGFKLLKEKKEFIILEKSNKNNSRLQSISNKDLQHLFPNTSLDSFVMELGASIIHTNQDVLMKLLKDLELDSEIEPLNTKEKSFFVYSKLETNDQKIMKKFYKDIDKFLSNKKDLIPIDYTLEDACKKLLPPKVYDFYKTCTFEWFELNQQNFHAYLLGKDREGIYCKFRHGISYIIDKLTSFLKSRILYDSEVKKIEKIKDQYIVYINDQSYAIKGNNIYLCTPISVAKEEIVYKNLQSVKNYLSLGYDRCCLRFYVYFKKPIPIEYSQIVGDFQSKWSIKITPHLWMISYVDGPLSCFLHSLEEEEVIINWINDMNKIFKTEISYTDVLFYKASFWKDAYTVLYKDFYKKNKNGIILGHQLLKEIPSSFTITCLPKDVGQDTAWMEANLL